MDKRLEVAIAAAKAGGEVALRYFRTGLQVEYKGDRSPVTRADRECEQRIVEVLTAAFPDYGVVGEELGERAGAGARWIIDPIDAYVRRFGPVSARQNFKAFAGDPDQPLLLSLEQFDAQTNRATKTAIFERRTLERYRPVEHVDSGTEALAISLNETGGVDWPRMEQLTGRTARQLQRELTGLVYCNPEGGLWETAEPVFERQCARQARHGPRRGGRRRCV